MRAALACLVVVSLAGAAGTGRGQQTQIPGAFRSAITLVPIDVRVLDRDGRPVTDLKQDDFTIVEDGIPQVIAHFEAHVLAPEPSVVAAHDGVRSYGGTQPAMRRAAGFDIGPQQNRIFLIVLGRGRLREPARAMDALVHFVRERLLPQDQAAVLAWNRATDFTTDHEKIATVLERFDRAHEGIEARLRFHFSGLQAAYGSKEIPAHIQEEIDGVFGWAGGAGRATPDLPSRTLPPASITDSRRIERESQEITADLLSSGNSLMTDLPFDEFVEENARTLQDVGNVYAGIEYLRFLEGEKHLLLMTEKGLFLPREEDDRRIAEAASTARVVIDPVETGGLYVGMSTSAIQGGPNPGQWSQFWAFTSLRTIAQLTGGQASITEYTRPALDRIDGTTRAGYLLGYYPKNMKWDGRYRKVTVTVAWPGLTLLYRHGYEASDQLVPFDRQAFLTFNRIISAALYPEAVRDIGLKVKARYVVRSPGSEVRSPGADADLSRRSHQAEAEREIAVEVTIAAARVSFRDDESKHVAHLDIAVMGTDSRGRTTDDRWQTIDLALGDADYERCWRDGIPYSVRLPFRPATRGVKVIVYDYAGDLLGSAVARVF